MNESIMTTDTPTQRDMTWLYTSINDPKISQDNAKVSQAIHTFVKKWKTNKEYKKDPRILRQVLDAYQDLRKKYYYGTKESIFLRAQSMLTQDESIKAASNKAELVSRDLMLELDFFELALGKTSPKQQKIFLSDVSLSHYHYYLQRIFQTAKHHLTQAEEKIITLLSKGANADRSRMISDFFATSSKSIKDPQGDKHQLPFEQLMTSLSDTDKTTRDQAAKAIHAICKQHAPAAERELNAILEYRFTMDQLRGYTRPDQSRHISDDVPSEVVDTLVQVVSQSYNISHEYYQLKAQLLKQDHLAYHERNVSILFAPEPQFTRGKAVKIVDATLSDLDPKFGKIFNQFIQQGQIDVYPAQGKQGGAFQASLGPTYRNLVFLNYTHKLYDVTTLAHEMGHAIHSYISNQKQPALYYGYGMFTAEVASTYMEDFVYERVMSQADDKMKLSLMMQKLNDAISTIFRQIACYTFEQELHTTFRQRGFLSMETIGHIFQLHMESYMGPYVMQDKGSENRRTYRSHIRNYFYVYSYASGYIISKTLQAKTKADPSFVKIYRNIFLAAGRSESPKDTFAKMGIDIADQQFWQQGIDQIREMLLDAKKLAKKLHYV